MTDKQETPENRERAERLKAAFRKSMLPADHPLSTMDTGSSPTHQEEKDPVQAALDVRRREILDAENAKRQKRQNRLGGPKVVKM